MRVFDISIGLVFIDLMVVEVFAPVDYLIVGVPFWRSDQFVVLFGEPSDTHHGDIMNAKDGCDEVSYGRRHLCLIAAVLAWVLPKESYCKRLAVAVVNIVLNNFACLLIAGVIDSCSVDGRDDFVVVCCMLL